MIDNEQEVRIRQLEEELAKAHWHLNASQRIAGVGSWQIIMKDKDTTLPGSHQWSDEVFRLLGYEPGAVTVSNDLFFSHLHPDDVPIVEAAIQQSINHCTPYDIEHRLIRRDGTIIMVHERGEAECIDIPGSGRWLKLIGTVQDITSNIRAANNEASLKSIFDNTSLAYILLDEQLNIVAFNRAAYTKGTTLLGITLVEGSSMLAFITEARRAAVSKMYTSAAQGKKHTYEHCFPLEDGAQLWGRINLFPIYLDKNKVMGVAISIEDITEQKRSVDILRANRAKYRSFFMNSLNALLLTKCDGPILEANPEACKLFGMTEAEIRSTPPHALVDITHPDFIPLIECRRRTGQARGELSFIRKDGSRFPGIITSVLYTDTNGEQHTSMSIHDITDRKKAEEELRQKNRELRRLMDQLSTIREEERTTIAREIHDELGQQLSTVKMGVRRVSAKLQQHELTDDITDNLLGEIDEAIKSVRRIASNLRPIILDYEGLTAALRWYASEFEKLHSIPCRLNVDMPVDIEDKKIAITLFRVLQETFTNIIRHADAARIEVDMRIERGAVMLTIIDDGIGIDANEVKRKKTFGLISMKERVAMVGGEYAIDSRRPKGTITRVSVPYDPA